MRTIEQVEDKRTMTKALYVEELEILKDRYPESNYPIMTEIHWSKRTNNPDLRVILIKALGIEADIESGKIEIQPDSEQPAKEPTEEQPEPITKSADACDESWGKPDLNDEECRDCDALENCKAQQIFLGIPTPASKTTRKIGAGRTPFGHAKGAISGKIDIALGAELGITFADVAILAECTEQRVKHHVNKDLLVGLRANGIPAVLTDLGDGKYRLETPTTTESTDSTETPTGDGDSGEEAATA